MVTSMVGGSTRAFTTDDDGGGDDVAQEYATGVGPLCPPLSDEVLPKLWLVEFDASAPEVTIKLKGKDYMQVVNRTTWFVADQRAFIRAGVALMPYSIKTKLVAESDGWAEYEATVTDVFGNSVTMSGSESVADFNDYREKAQTKAAGRALEYLGYGIAFAGDEENELSGKRGERPVDSPAYRRSLPAQPTRPAPTTQRAQPPQRSAPAPHPSASSADPNDGQKLATEQQLTSIGKLCSALNRDEPDKGISYEQARQLLTTLSADYQQQRRAQQSTSAEK